jgi:hypothetical protein
VDLFKTPTIAIIGTAGRRDDGVRLKSDSFDRMYDTAVATIIEWGIKAAVSGGAAWADHVAVKAYLEGAVTQLHLHFPTTFANGRFVGKQYGDVANFYHDKFTAVRGLDSYRELEAAIEKGATVTVGRGFKPRNLAIGRDATHMLALTFGAGKSEVLDSLRNDVGYRDAIGGCLKDGVTAFHGSGPDLETRRKALTDFGPSETGFMDSAAAGLRDGGTAHAWSHCRGAEIKRHVHLGILFQDELQPTEAAFSPSDLSP